MDKSKKKISITLVMCIIALLLIIGGSYALWNKTIETENSGLEVYSTELNLLESDSEIINIENAFPMIDEVGMKQEDTFDFEVKTKTKKDINIRYDLVIEKIGLKCSEIENPTVEEHYECYDMTISEEDRQKLINYMSEYLDLTIEEATEYYDLLYTKDDEGLKDFYIRIYDITEEIAEENVAEDKDRGYIHWIIYNYENDYGFELSVKKTDYEMLPLSTREIQETYTFNSENRIFYNNLYDDEIKV